MPWPVRLGWDLTAASAITVTAALTTLPGNTWDLAFGIASTVVVAVVFRKADHVLADGGFRPWVRPLRELVAPKLLARFGYALTIGIIMLNAGRALHDQLQAVLPTVLGVTLIGIAGASWLLPSAPTPRTATGAPA